MNKVVVSIYGSHNGSVSLSIDDKIVEVIEIERLISLKNAGLYYYLSIGCADQVLEEIKQYFRDKYGVYNYDVVLFQHTNGEEDRFPSSTYIECLHHQSHAANSFYQSDDERALIFSFDGGGNDGFFNVYLADRQTGIIKLGSHHQDLGFPYMIFGHYMNDIRREPLWIGNLVYSGKIMGLCAYGNVREEWFPNFKWFYKSNPEGPEDIGSYKRYIEELGRMCDIKFDMDERLSGQIAYDVAATSQKAFEEVFLEYAKPYMIKYPDLPIHMAGGCALNIILNTRLKEEFGKDVFVAPNPNDCGLSSGMLLDYLKPNKKVDLTYKGSGVLDRNMLSYYMSSRPVLTITSYGTIVDDLHSGLILGVVHDGSEHGPRALGNRSILCVPGEGMKDILNSKVKNREWYRPFAPVVRIEDVNEYFEWDSESRWMSFSPKVREEYKSKLPAITHADGTARVQTVRQYENPFLYNILTIMKERGMIPVLLNTSFNVHGKPIVNSYKEAFEVFDNTQMDRLLLDKTYYFKK